MGFRDEMMEPVTSMVDREAAAAFLEERFGAHSPHDVGEIGAGAWSQAYAFSHGGRDYVIRFAALREDFERDRIAAGFSSAALLVPRTVEIGDAFGGYYSITERVSGDFLEEADGARMRRILPTLFAALDAARRIDLSASTGYGDVDVDGNAPHPSWRAALLDVARDDPGQRTHGWRERLRLSRYGLGPFDAAYASMASLAPRCPNDRHVIHSDLINRNVFIAGDRITGVIDWGCLMYGDSLYDLAWLIFWSPWYPAWRDIDFAGEAARHARGTGRDLHEAAIRLQCYEIHIGLRHFAYNAFLGRWQEYEECVARTMAIVEGATQPI